ncbi:hypothetical protein CORT_0A05090 [Candida orthopsilosis Co 90-125]|uniref:Uncharacterized protein n=1 Tax=Candida orthopsilosis (strain 90-125) TaxID=1136231 RepID=H8WXV0_CANO9|nr:hypothetical protein CORT_0A05090 [Candida orthopsilosis Co 90-125]CCG20897.1 hypothetical protein CORT_0A05090 [Candida orthopsilosis Co 90-125]
MPLDLFQENGNSKHYNFTELRLEIIGNKDLKFKLLNDVTFMNQLVSIFADSISKFNISANDPVYTLNKLEEPVVILHILSSFASEIESLNNDSVSGSIGIMQLALDPITQLLNHFVETFVPSLRVTDGDKYLFQVETLMGHCLDILIILSNLRQNQIDPNRVWRFIALLLIATGNTHDHLTKLHPSIIIKSLRLVPLVLTTAVPLKNNAILTLSVVLLSRLSSDCQLIVSTHLSELYRSPEDLYWVAFEDDHLPNVDLNAALIDEMISVELLLELITAAAQVMSFSKNYHDPFLLAGRQNTPLGIFLSTPLSKPVIPITEIYTSLLLLMKVNSKGLNLASLNLLVLLLENLSVSEVLSESIIFRNYEKLFASIVHLLDSGSNPNGGDEMNGSKGSKNKGTLHINPVFDEESTSNASLFLTSAVKVLADLCTSYPTLSNRICDTNIDYKLISKVEYCYKHSGLFKVFEDLKLRSKFGTVLVDFTSMPIRDAYSAELADLLLLLSVYTSEREEYRNRLVSFYQSTGTNIPQVIFDIVEDYHFLLNQMRLLQKILSHTVKTKSLESERVKHNISWLGKNLGVISKLENSPLFTHCLYFIRSQSRSVATLRTFFVETNSFKSFVTRDNKDTLLTGIASFSSNISTIRPRIEPESTSIITSEPGSTSSAGGFVTNILEIIRLYETLDLTRSFIFRVNKNKFVQEVAFKKSFMTNKALCVSLLANFILDFSSFRYKIIGYENFLSSLSIIYQNSATDFDVDVSGLTEEDIFERNVMQLKILQVMKNFMYNEASENKQEVLNFFPLSLILQKANYGITGSGTSSVPTETSETKLRQKVVAFEILRNFTAGSPSFSQILRESYIDEYLNNEKPELQPLLPQNWSEFVIRNLTEASIFTPQSTQSFNFDNDETLVELIGNEDYVKMVRSINFTEDHTYTVIDKLKQELFPNDTLLHIWMRLLSFKLPESVISNVNYNPQYLTKNLNMIKISIAWILVNLTWKSSVFGYDIQNYTDYEVYQTVDTSRIKRALSQQEKNEQPVTEQPEKEQELVGDELSVYDRAKYLDKFGFTKVIYDVLTDYSRRASKIPRASLASDSSIEPEVFEKLRSALHQINYLCRGVRSGGFVPDLRTKHASKSNELRLQRNQDNSVDVVDDIGDLVDDEIRYERSRRRDAIDSEDDGNNEDEEMREDDSSESGPETQVRQVAGNESDDSNEDMPHEYWVM